jgi:hypothetical protein
MLALSPSSSCRRRPPRRVDLETTKNGADLADTGHALRRVVVSTRHLPVRPNLDQLKHQARDLLAAIRRGDADALSDLRTHHRRQIDPARAQLADAQHVLARSYGVASWPRLVLACRMTDAICRDDLDTGTAAATRGR